MIILDEYNNEIDIANIENKEQKLAEKYIHSDDIVLELGARYGSVSCVINEKLSIKTNHVVIEPDHRVWDTVTANRDRNNCGFHIVKGYISNTVLDLIPCSGNYGGGRGYGTKLIESESSSVPRFTLDYLYSFYHIHHFNVLVADCEGCFPLFLKEYESILDQLRLIIFEKDRTNECDYSNIDYLLDKHKFMQLEFIKPHHFVYGKIYA